jgi:hypothetical protein
MYGYVKELRARVQHPLVVTEFGLPNSIGISHFHPYGWHHGGHSEEQQAQIVSRLAESIQQAGAAGGIAFALIDEWYKHNWLIKDFENPDDRSALWLNELDPEKRYGMVGFRSSKWKLFSDPTAWAGADTLYEGKAGGVRRVQAAVDEAFLYLRLEGACTECDPSKAYAIAMNTLPSNAGFRNLPVGGGVRAFQGANFLLYLKDAESSRLLIADNYNPYQLVPRIGVPGETELTYKRNFASQLQDTGTLQEMIIETNRRRFGRDGTMFPAQRYSRSTLRYAASESERTDTLPEWYSDKKTKTIVVRIPWGKLYVTDPSSHRVFKGFSGAGRPELQTSFSAGVDVSVLELEGAQMSTAKIAGSFPALRDGHLEAPARVTWKNWETVELVPYEKRAFGAMEKVFLEQNGVEQVQTGRSLRAAGDGVRGTAGAANASR